MKKFLQSTVEAGTPASEPGAGAMQVDAPNLEEIATDRRRSMTNHTDVFSDEDNEGDSDYDMDGSTKASTSSFNKSDGTTRSWWQECGFKEQALEVCYTVEDGEGDILGTAPKQGLGLFASEAVRNPSSRFPNDNERGASCQDVVFNVGGPVWALDWCPRRGGWSALGIQDEFLVVGAYPRETPQHLLGVPLRGKGLLQIWAVDLMPRKSRQQSGELVDDEEPSTLGEADDAQRARVKDRGRGGKWGRGRGRGRGRPRVHHEQDRALEGRAGTNVLLDEELNIDASLIEDKTTLLGFALAEAARGRERGRGRGRGRGTSRGRAESTAGPIPSEAKAGTSDSQDPDNGSFRFTYKARPKGARAAQAEPLPSSQKHSASEPLEGLPKIVFGIAHEGKVTWDAKWRPVAKEESTSGCVGGTDEREPSRLGFLAAVLGDGSVQVFDVPLPSMLESAGIQQQEKTGKGPLVIQLNPIFRSSDLQSNGHKSVPLCVEWSTWAPHELLLVGCHDGTVGVFKAFPCSSPLQETRPLIFFTADFMPLRTVAWAPAGSGAAGKHLVATTGHSGYLRFWDLRDPFRPHSEMQISRGCITSIDWISDPRCMLFAMDDGSVRMFGLDNAATDTPVTGKPYSGTILQGLVSYFCSFYAMWGVHVSRASGLVAYGGADGSVLHFQLTEKALLKDGARHRKPHYLCGAFAADSETGVVSIISQDLATAPPRVQKTSTEPAYCFRRDFIARRNSVVKSNGAGSGFLPSGCPLDMEKPAAKKRKADEASAKPKKPSKKKQGGKGNDADADAELLEDSKDAVQLVTSPLRELVLIPSDGLGDHTEPEGSLGTVENLPLRVVAVQRLRWNCNRRRETWLAFGGASGIMRCQYVLPKD